MQDKETLITSRVIFFAVLQQTEALENSHHHRLPVKDTYNLSQIDLIQMSLQFSYLNFISVPAVSQQRMSRLSYMYIYFHSASFYCCYIHFFLVLPGLMKLTPFFH